MCSLVCSDCHRINLDQLGFIIQHYHSIPLTPALTTSRHSTQNILFLKYLPVYIHPHSSQGPVTIVTFLVQLIKSGSWKNRLSSPDTVRLLLLILPYLAKCDIFIWVGRARVYIMGGEFGITKVFDNRCQSLTRCLPKIY